MDTIELKITIDKEAVEAIMTMLGALADRMSDKLADKESREESTKEESKEITNNTLSNNKNNINISSNSVCDSVNNNLTHSVDNNLTHNNESDTLTPNIDDVTNYVNSCGYDLNANKFYLYYKNNGWKTKSGISMVDRWREFVDMWAKNEVNKPMSKPATGGRAGMGTVEERRRTHPFVPTNFDDL